jgi:hypothetical protein
MIVNYVEYDPANGDIISCGHCSENLFPPPSEKNGVFIKTDTPITFGDTFYDLKTKSFKQKSKSNCVSEMRRYILDDLSRTDYTQTIDAPEHIDAFLIEEWKQYRSNLRTAYNLETVDAIIAALPTSDPKGLDFYKQFRS